MKQYEFRWKSHNGTQIRVFDDVQWKDYGARVTDDQNGGYSMIIPYTSIYDIRILSDDEKDNTIKPLPL